MKILYAANNSYNSYFQLNRFLSSVKHKSFDIKIAAYKKSSGNFHIDYTLDSLLNLSKQDKTISFNGNYTFYYNEIKRFSPDLIISDFDIYSALIAIELNIKFWIVSPILLYTALDKQTKYNIGIYKKYNHIIDNDPQKKLYIDSILNNADKRLVVSHLGDSNIDLYIDNKFEFVRPEFILSNHISNEIEYLLMTNNKSIFDVYKNYNSILFTDYVYEKYNTLQVKNIYDAIQYKILLGKCKNFICNGSATLIADAFYNEKKYINYIDYTDIESIIVSSINTYYTNQKIQINDNIMFLSQHLENI